MLIVYGFALLSASVLMVSFVAKAKNSPSAPKWTTFKALVNVLLFAAIAGIIFGVAFLFQAAFDFRNVHFGAIEAVLLIAAIGATYLAARKLRAMGHAAATTTPESPGDGKAR